MKKTIINLLGAGVLVGTLFVTSCSKDKLTKEEALQMEADAAAAQAKLDDSLLQAGGVIRYSVLVYSANQSSGKKEKTTGLGGAIVTLAQNGSILTVTCDANGIAVFPNCRIGNAAVVVYATDHATLNYKTNLDPGANSGNMSGTSRMVSTILPMFATTGTNNTATITGKATIELDLTNTSREAAMGVTVGAYVDANPNNNNSFYYTYFADEDYYYTANNFAGQPTEVTFETALSTTTTDVNGNYTLVVPAAVDYMPIQLYFGDVVANQTLVARYLSNENPNPSTWASVKTVRTFYGSSHNYSGYYGHPSYSPVVATISAPPAQGSGAAVSLKFKAQDADGATGGLNVVQTGTLTPGSYSIDVTGGDYDANLTMPSTSTPASLTLVVPASGIVTTGDIQGTYGYGYRSQPVFTVNYTGANAVTIDFLTNSRWNSSVADFNVGQTTFNDGDAGSTITGGSGYVVAPGTRWISQGGSTTPSTSTINTSGVVNDVTIPGAMTGNFYVLPTVVFEPQQSLQAYTGNVSVNSSTGQITGTSVVFGGAGYSTLAGSVPPTITFSSLVSGFTPTNPTATVVLSGTTVNSVSILYGGAGWPTQSNANSPSGYEPFSTNNTSFYVQPGSVYVNDVYYGTGTHEYGAN